jgi:CubicO group peptidase (beta-lactamase class C family)
MFQPPTWHRCCHETNVFTHMKCKVPFSHQRRNFLLFVPLFTFTLLQAEGEASYSFAPLDSFITDNLSLFEDEVAVYIYEGDTLIYSYEAGFDRYTAMPIASATKWISGAIMLAVAEAGYFDLDDPISRYLPDFDREGKRDITLRHAFSMTAGMTADTWYENGLSRSSLYTHEDSVARIARDLPMGADPGSEIYYLGSGMQAAGLAAVYATGLPDWQSVAEQFLLDPLDMQATTYTAFAPNPAVAGGVVTTADDYLKLIRMVHHNGLHEGSPVLATASVDEFFSSEGREKPITRTPIPASSDYFPFDADIYYTFGAWALGDNPVTGEVEEIVSPGAFGTHPWIDRRRGLWGIVFTHVTAGTSSAVEPSLGIFDYIRKEYDRLHPERVPVLSLGGESSNWIDPEIHPNGDAITFQTGDGIVYYGRLNPVSGQIVEGSLEIVDTGVTPLSISWNGPEFAVDSLGWSLIYNKPINGLPQLWQARRTSGDWSTQPVFPDTTFARSTFLTHQAENLPETWVLYTMNDGSGSSMTAATVQHPENEITIAAFEPRQPAHGRFLAGEAAVVLASGAEQIPGSLTRFRLPQALPEEIITHAGTIELPVSVHAPELDGALMVGAVLDGKEMHFYTQSPSGTWSKVGQLSIPQESLAAGFTHINSPEAFVFHERTFVCLSIEKPDSGIGPVGEAQIWMIAPDVGPYPEAALRTDNHIEGLLRTDPEFYVTADAAEVYAIYNVINSSLDYTIRRSRSGLGSLQTTPIPPSILATSTHWILSWDSSTTTQLYSSTDLLDWQPLSSAGSPQVISIPKLAPSSPTFWRTQNTPRF